MNDSFVIREATVEDVGELARLYRQLSDDSAENPVDEQALARVFARTRDYPGYRVLLAVDEGRVVGSFVLVILEMLGWRCAPEALVEDVVVERKARGRGIGRRMMAFAMNEAALTGCYKLVLSSNLERTGAHSFYERLGFRQHGLSFQIDFEVATRSEHG
jgi:GNAT superfamily N-acetyltransferase